MLQCVAVCCSVLLLDLSELIDVLHYVIVCCTVMHCVALRFSVLQLDLSRLMDVLQSVAHVAECCIVLQCCVATRLYLSELMDVLQCVACVLRVRFSTLQCVAVRCSVLQCVAVYYYRTYPR